MKFRALTADEIECRIGQVGKSGNGLSLLLYKDSRSDMDILDETLGVENWQCKYDVINGELFCTVSIWDETKAQWISKQDLGSPSNVEAEKGRSSDALKRTCVRLGIGRELYTAPFIWIPAEKCNLVQRGNGYTCYDRFKVAKIQIDENPNTGRKRITGIRIVNEKTGQIVYSWKES